MKPLQSAIMEKKQEVEALQYSNTEKDGELLSLKNLLGQLEEERAGVNKNFQGLNYRIKELETLLAQKDQQLQKSNEAYQIQLNASLKNAEYLAGKVEQLVASTDTANKKAMEAKPYATRIAEQQGIIQDREEKAEGICSSTSTFSAAARASA